jgi:hypothetical protein
MPQGVLPDGPQAECGGREATALATDPRLHSDKDAWPPSSSLSEPRIRAQSRPGAGVRIQLGTNWDSLSGSDTDLVEDEDTRSPWGQNQNSTRTIVRLGI